MEKIKIDRLIKNSKYNYLRKYNIYIEKVEILEKRMILKIYCTCNLILDNKINKDLELLFKELFPEFNKIDIIKKFQNIDAEDFNIDIYIDNIKSQILEDIPSSNSWIDDLKFKIKDLNIKLLLPRQICLYSLKQNNFLENLKKQIKDEIGYELEIVEPSIDIDYKNSILREKEMEEREISKKAIEEIKRISAENTKKNAPKKVDNYKFGKDISKIPIEIDNVNLDINYAAIEGQIFDMECKELKSGRCIITLLITDYTNSMPVKTFLSKDKAEEFMTNVKVDEWVQVEGSIDYDNFSRMISMLFKSLRKVSKPIKTDTAEKKRIELHAHSKMSAMDGVCDVKELIKRAKDYGHDAIAITDHGVVQGFPEALEASEKMDIKVIYGLEGYLVDDEKDIVKNYSNEDKWESYVVFDLETTGLSPINDGITEIGALKVQNGEIIDNFSTLINPGKKIPDFIVELTGITNDMVKDKPTIQEVISDFYKFIDGSILVAHNATFDIGFIREKLKLINKELENPIIDTLELARKVFPTFKNYRLNTLAKHLDVDLQNHHRAVDDAKATTEIFLKMLDLLKERNVNEIGDLNELSVEDIDKSRPYHVVILVKNLRGLKNLYKLVSISHLNYFYRNPRIPKSLLRKYREGLIIGSACEAGELYQSILNRLSYDEIRNIVNFYDYLEIQPIDNNLHLIDRGILKDKKQLEDINKEIYKLGKKYNKPVVATCDVHFLDPTDEVFRRILMAGQGFSDADNQPPLYFRTTDEMLKEFEYLGVDASQEVVIENTHRINDKIDNIRPIPKGTYPPVIEGSDKELREISYKKAYEIYGDPLPEIVEKRLKRELNAIIENGYSVMYIIGEKLVSRSLKDGYLVGSRGSVGSSLVATMSGITEVNPLVPHYVCPSCQYSKFFTDGKIASGSDLKDENCPRCETKLIKDGHDIPFEVFLGFDGDKEPDIDLNFASEYQPKAHKYVEELFGSDYVFRAGTIGTIADKTAYGFVKKYFESKDETVNPVETERLVRGCSGVRRSSGQHPGGIMIVPHNKEIYDFTPIQYPANDKEAGVITTHFDYDAISEQILKLDILGHDVPSIIKMLEDMTGVKAMDIPLDEKNTMAIFSSTKTLGISPDDINCPVGSLGIPEFGTPFVRQMLIDTKPSKFSELVRISGLSHGTDVWLNNAQILVRQNIAELSEVISTREDIMLTLINSGLEKKTAFWIMEKVRKGKPLSEEELSSMSKLDLPDWYIDSCEKIKYMFPKAHAVAYVMMSFRIAYFKVYHPLAFYATYFTTKASDFDAELILQGREVVNNKIIELEQLGMEATAKEKNLLIVLEVVREMYARDYKFKKVDLYKSDSDVFIIEDEKILPPLKGLEGVGENAARNIVEARKDGEFLSVEDLTKRTKITKTAVEALKKHGCLENLPESNQLDLLDMFNI